MLNPRTWSQMQPISAEAKLLRSSPSGIYLLIKAIEWLDGMPGVAGSAADEMLHLIDTAVGRAIACEGNESLASNIELSGVYCSTAEFKDTDSSTGREHSLLIGLSANSAPTGRQKLDIRIKVSLPERTTVFGAEGKEFDVYLSLDQRNQRGVLKFRCPDSMGDYSLDANGGFIHLENTYTFDMNETEVEDWQDIVFDKVPNGVRTQMIHMGS